MILPTMALNLDHFFRAACQNPESVSKWPNQPFKFLTTSPYEFSSAWRRVTLLRKTPAAAATVFYTVWKKCERKLCGNPQSCAKVEPYSRFVWANSVKLIPPLLILDGPIIIDSRFQSYGIVS